MKKILAVLLLTLLLTGCKGQAQPELINPEDYELPNVSKVVETNANIDTGYNYLIDNNTGVVYLEYKSGYGRAITIMFNADGTVMTEKDILKEKQ